MIYVMRGTNASGKDRFVTANFMPHTVLSSDQMRLQLFDDVTEQKTSEIVFEQLKQMLELRLRYGVNYTVMNATHLRYADVDPYVQLARKFGHEVTVISIDPPPLDELVRRTKLYPAGAKATVETLTKHLNRYENSIPRFEEVAAQNWYFNFKRITQDWELVDAVLSVS